MSVSFVGNVNLLADKHGHQSITMEDPYLPNETDGERSLLSTSNISPHPTLSITSVSQLEPQDVTISAHSEDNTISSSLFFDVPSDEDEDVFEDIRFHTPTAALARSPEPEYVVLFNDAGDEF